MWLERCWNLLLLGGPGTCSVDSLLASWTGFDINPRQIGRLTQAVVGCQNATSPFSELTWPRSRT